MIIGKWINYGIIALGLAVSVHPGTVANAENSDLAIESSDLAPQAKEWAQHPPGIRNAGLNFEGTGLYEDDREKLNRAYEWIKSGDEYKLIAVQRHLGLITDSPGGVDPYVFGISNQAKYREPAYWLLAAMADVTAESLNPIRNDLKRKNPALERFAAGVNNYYGRWIANDLSNDHSLGYYDRQIAEQFYDSIMVAANYAAYPFEKFNDDDESLETKKYHLNKAFESLKTRSFNNKLVAAWSAYTLRRHFDRKAQTHDNPDGTMIFRALELPIRELTDLHLKGLL